VLYNNLIAVEDNLKKVFKKYDNNNRERIHWWERREGAIWDAVRVAIKKIDNGRITCTKYTEFENLPQYERFLIEFALQINKEQTIYRNSLLNACTISNNLFLETKKCNNETLCKTEYEKYKLWVQRTMSIFNMFTNKLRTVQNDKKFIKKPYNKILIDPVALAYKDLSQTDLKTCLNLYDEACTK
ncbi:duffy binding protein, putative, partial [Hepatocystis sp. ex Piliocolobus tephrosceles]